MPKKIHRLPLLLLAAGLFVTMMLSINTQESALANNTQSQSFTAEGHLLQRYKDISALSMSKRKDLFRRASADDKSGLWKVHLALYLAGHPELTKEQKNIVLEAMALARPELFEISEGDFAWSTKVNKPLKSFKKRALDVFSKEEGAEIFAKLGGREPISSTWVDEPPIDEGFGTCVCSRTSDWCVNVCVGNVCERTADGCGTLWFYPCDGNHCS